MSVSDWLIGRHRSISRMTSLRNEEEDRAPADQVDDGTELSEEEVAAASIRFAEESARLSEIKCSSILKGILVRCFLKTTALVTAKRLRWAVLFIVMFTSTSLQAYEVQRLGKVLGGNGSVGTEVSEPQLAMPSTCSKTSTKWTTLSRGTNRTVGYGLRQLRSESTIFSIRDVLSEASVDLGGGGPPPKRGALANAGDRPFAVSARIGSRNSDDVDGVGGIRSFSDTEPDLDETVHLEELRTPRYSAGKRKKFSRADMIRVIRTEDIKLREFSVRFVPHMGNIKTYFAVKSLMHPARPYAIKALVLVGLTGVGKTTTTIKTLTELGISYNCQMSRTNGYFNPIDFEDTFVLDEFSPVNMDVTTFNEMLNMEPPPLNIKYAEAVNQFKYVIILTNKDPSTWWSREDASIRDAAFRRMQVVTCLNPNQIC